MKVETNIDSKKNQRKPTLIVKRTRMLIAQKTPFIY